MADWVCESGWRRCCKLEKNGSRCSTVCPSNSAKVTQDTNRHFDAHSSLPPHTHTSTPSHHPFSSTNALNPSPSATCYRDLLCLEFRRSFGVGVVFLFQRKLGFQCCGELGKKTCQGFSGRVVWRSCRRRCSGCRGRIRLQSCVEFCRVVQG